MKHYGYVRVSSKQQVIMGASLEAQEEQIKRYADYKKMEITEIVRDPAVSGKLPLLSRPGGQRLAMLLDRGDSVIFTKLDRGFRNTVDCLRTLEAWTARGISIHMLDMPIQDTSTPMGKMIVSVIAAVAEFERSRLRERMREANAQRRLGDPDVVIGPGTRWGHKVVKCGDGKKRYIIDKDCPKRAIARMCIELYDKSGMSHSQIYHHLVKHGILYRTRKGYKTVLQPNTIQLWIRFERAIQEKEKCQQPESLTANGSISTSS